MVEIRHILRVVLDEYPAATCPAADADDDGTVAIEDLVSAAGSAPGPCMAGATPTPTRTPNSDPTLPPLQQGLRQLSLGNLYEAGTAFALAYAGNPRDDTAKFYSCVANLATAIIDDPLARSLANRSGLFVSGTSGSVCDLAADVADDVPPGAPRTREIIAALQSNAVSPIAAAITCLRSISPSARIYMNRGDLPPCWRGGAVRNNLIEIDHGEIQAALATLEGSSFAIALLQSYDADIDLASIVNGTAERLITTHPRLGTQPVNSQLALARIHLDRASEAVVAAIDTIRAESDGQHDDLLVIDADDVTLARQLRLVASQLRDALYGTARIPIDIVSGHIALMDIGLAESERLNLSPFFSGQLASLRNLLPPFTANGHLNRRAFPDPTFAGMTPDLTQYKLDNLLRGGPACVRCSTDDDCDPLGISSFYCDRCYGYYCNDPTLRCRREFDQLCTD